MKNILNIFLFTLLTNQLNAQEFAEFTTDTTRIHSNSQRERMAKEIWYINGQEMHYDTKVVKIKVNPTKFDTIIYYKRNQKTYDTVICNVAAPNKYTIIYNECCEFFNVRSETTRVNGSILFQLKNTDTENIYLGKVGMTGILVDEKNTQAIYDICQSAMSSAISFVSFSQVEPCESFDYDNENCNEVCLWQGYDEDYDITDYEFQYISSKMYYKWLGLNPYPLTVIYDPDTDKTTYK